MNPPAAVLSNGVLDGEPHARAARIERVVRVVLWLTVAEGLIVSAALAFGGPTWGTASPLHGASLSVTLALTGVLLGLSILLEVRRGWRARVAEAAGRLAADRRWLWWAAAVFSVLLFGCIVALFGISLLMNPDVGPLIQTFLARGLLPLWWMTLIAFQTWVVLLLSSTQPARTGLIPLIAGGVALALLTVYWYGAEGQLLRFNVDMGLTDQSAYLDFARRLKDSGYTYPGDFNRMPVYPFLLSLVLRPGMTDAAFFLAAKYLSLFLSMLLLVVLAAIFFRRFESLHAFNLTLITAFTVFVYKAGWVQSELVFYVLNTILFLLLWTLLRRPDFATAAAAGVVAAAAHLTKASLWPGLLAFVVAILARAVLGAPADRRSRLLDAAAWRKSLLVLVVSGVVFLAALSPYLATSRRITGRYFYNVNSTFYVWYDSWEEAEAGTKAHGDRVGWPVMPEGEIPSLQKYLAEHTPSQMAARISAGARKVMDRVLHSSGYFDYVVVYGAALLAAAVFRWRRARRLVLDNAPLVLFLLLYFGLYVLAYFWYAPIAAGDRLILALFIPLLLTFSSGLQAVLGGDRLKVDRRSVSWLTVINLVVLGMILLDALWAVQQGVYVLRGGG